MRINRFIALATGVSRRAADRLADAGEILVNGRPIRLGQEIANADRVTYHGKHLQLPNRQTIMLNKPVGYVCSRDGQGSKTIYDLLPSELHSLKPVGRLDKSSSGLLLLTNDGELAHQLTHPSFEKEKAYEVELNKPLTLPNAAKIEHGIQLEDGPSKLQLRGSGKIWQVRMHEGRNRQIRRTFGAFGYEVARLHRTHFGKYTLDNLPLGKFQEV
jgi:23S rRNA pseudouridine2605 synthase